MHLLRTFSLCTATCSLPLNNPLESSPHAQRTSLCPENLALFSLCSSAVRKMPIRAGNIDLSDAITPEPIVLDPLEVLDPHVWDAEPVTLYDQVPPLTKALEELEASLSNLDTHRKVVKIRREEPAPLEPCGVVPCGTPTRSRKTGQSCKSTVVKQRLRHYKRPTASKFCHVCARKSTNVPVVVCSRIEEGLCRKVVCEYCLQKYGWQGEAHGATRRTQEIEGMNVDSCRERKGVWVCPHCSGQCVARAQCNTYGKVNYRRHLKLRRKKDGASAGAE